VRCWLLALVLVMGAGTSVVSGQSGARAEVRVTEPSKSPQVQVRNLLAESTWRNALDDAYKIALEWRVELWRPRRWFDEHMSTTTFTMVIYQEQLLDQYVMVTVLPGREPQETRFNNLRDLVMQLERPFTLEGLGPRQDGEWWFTLRLRVVGLNDAEYRELLDAGGAIPGGGNINSRLFRLLGLPPQTLQARTARFRTGN
jgi:hypothetical protein